MIPRHPDDCPSCVEEQCDLRGCHEPWAGEVDRDNGPRSLRLCEVHHDAWTRAEREYAAEREEVSGRFDMSALFGLARVLDARWRTRRVS